ncbi:MAG: hypothetical protein UY79_C0011G0005, partial [Parcubacteria group bacterium GW2011_GWA2_53_21]
VLDVDASAVPDLAAVNNLVDDNNTVTETADTNVPTISSVQEFDVNGDGSIDEVLITLSESLDDSNVVAANFTVGGTATDTVLATTSTNGTDLNTSDDTQITISVATGVSGTEAKALAYTAGTFVDLAGNNVGTTTVVAGSVTDSAAPIILTAVYSDLGTVDGKVDRVVLTYSESVTFVVEAGDWAFSTAGSINMTGDFDDAECNTGSATITCTDAGTGTVDADANETGGTTDPALTYNNTDGDGSVTDGTNVVAGQGITVTDGARPILLSASPASGGVLIPATTNFTLTFSEDLTTSAENTANIVVTATIGTPTYTLSEASGVVTVDPSGSTFSPGVTATVTVGTGVVDAAGNTYNTAATVATEPYSFTTQNPSSGGGGGGGGGGGSSTVSVVSDAVTVASPNGGEVLTGGAQHDITWTSTGNVNNVMLYYSVDGGSAFGLIAAGTANDGTYAWTVPNTATGQALVKIVGRDAGGATLATDQSNATFTIGVDTAIPVAEAPTGTSEVSAPSGSMSRVDAEAALPDTINVDYLVRVQNDGDPTTDYDTTVYYVGLDAKRHPFPSSQIYFTWYENFDQVRTIEGAVLTAIPLGTPVLVRPGTMMVKIQSDARTFAVEPGDYTIRWVPTEEVAVALYGSAWNTRIVDIEPTYWSRFTMGSDLTADLHPAGSVLKDAAGAKYYYDGVNKRAFASDAAFSANMFQNKYVINNPSSTGWSSAAAGTAIAGFEDGLFSLQR